MVKKWTTKHNGRFFEGHFFCCLLILQCMYLFHSILHQNAEKYNEEMYFVSII